MFSYTKNKNLYSINIKETLIFHRKHT